MENIFKFTDGLGPLKVVHVYEPSVNLKAVLVVDNIAKGPSIGGVRMAADVSTEECMRLARAMTFKNAAAGLAYGGGKSVLYGHPHAPPQLLGFIGGLGGRNISLEEFYEIADVTRNAVAQKQTPPPRLLYTEQELHEMRKLQAVASVEREELNNSGA